MKFKIMGKHGDAAFDYADDIVEVKFKELSKTMLPMEITPSGNKALTKFNPDSDTVVWMPKIMGG
jgi:hypothetical protein